MGRSSAWHPTLENDLTLHFVCPRPERLSWTPHRCQLKPTSDGRGGLFYGGARAGLVYPLTYGRQATDSRNVGTLLNNGSSRAYPVFTVYGGFDSGVILQFSGGSSIRWTGSVGGTPLVLDCRLGTATMGGRDVSRYLMSRGFPTVQSGGSLSVSLQSAGTGYVDCLVRDTWM